MGSNPIRLKFSADAKYVATVIAYGKLRFEQETEVDFKGLSEKIRGMLREHLDVTGLKMLVTLPSITDPAFWYGLGHEDDEKDIKTAALKKAAALKKTLTAKTAENPAKYATLSERVQELIDAFGKNQIDSSELYRGSYETAVELIRKEVEYEDAGLELKAHGFYSILTADLPPAAKTAGRRFTEKGIRRLIAAFKAWKHPRCASSVAPFELGGGSEAKARRIVELLEEVANAPMPKFVTDKEGEASYADLAERVVRAPERVLRADSTDKDELGPWLAWVFLGVEPLLFKVMALLEPERTKAIVGKGRGLGGLVTELKKVGRIPYDLDLTPEQFEALDGWSERSMYNNAVRDVMGVRIQEAHKAPQQNRELWSSALAVMLGVIEQNEEALRSALAPQAEQSPLSENGARKAGEDPGDEFSDEENALRKAAEELAELFQADATAPLNWQLNPAVKQDLRKQAKRLLMKQFERGKREPILDAVVDHGIKHFSKTRA